MPTDIDFSFYGLTSNPFLKESQTLPMINRDENKEDIKSIIGEFLGSDSPGIMVLWGDYGMGKTFTLRKVGEYLEEGDWTGTRKKVLPIFLKSIDPEEKGRYLPNLFGKIIAYLGQSGVEKLVRQVNKSETKRFALFKILARAAEGDDVAMDWLLGRGVTAGELRKLGVRYTPNTYSEVRGIFFEFIAILKAAGYDSMVLLIDEWEFLMSVVSRTRLWSIVREIQRLYDTYGEENQEWNEKHATLIFILASSAGAWFRLLTVSKELSSKLGGATTDTFLRRIAEKGKVDLSPLSKNHIKELVFSRMEPSRTDSPMRGTIEPFSDDYLSLMERVTYGIPSRVLRYGALLLSEGARTKTPKIDAQFGEKVLKEFGLWEEMTPVRAGAR